MSSSIPQMGIMPICVSDLISAWKKIRKPKSHTIDTLGICPKMIDMSMKSLNFQSTLSSIFNLFIASESIPEPLKKSRIVPLPKTSNPSSPNEFRPIAIQPVLTKCLEKCLMPNLVSHFESNNLFSVEQFGFRKNHTTTHVLISITDFIYETLDNIEICFLISLDFRKAFDKVDREVLIEKLKWYNVDSGLLQSLLSNRSQYVSCKCDGNDVCSDTKYTHLGVPQGACTSCLFFNVMINDLPDVVKNCKIRLFADDGNLLIKGALCNLNTLTIDVEDDLCRISSWVVQNRLPMNDEKVFFVCFCKPSMSSSLINVSISMKGSPIKRVNCVKILGCHLDENCSWSDQLSAVSRKCYLSLSPLYPIRTLVSLESRIILVRSLVLSKLYYGAAVWFNGSRAHQKSIDKIIRSCARYALNKSKYDSVSYDMTTILKWLNCKYRIQFELLKLAFNIVNGNCPEMFKNYFDLTPVVIRSTRSGTRVSNAIVCKSSWGEKSFRNQASKLWINLPTPLKDISSLQMFKVHVYDYLLNLQLDDQASHENSNVCNLSCIDSVLNCDDDDD
jgi:hypothetical protein